MSDDFDDLIGDIEGELDLTLYADAPELVTEVTSQILAAIERGLKVQSQFHLVLTGGTLGVQISEFLLKEWNAQPDAFAGLHIWWSDERFVEFDSSDRNDLELSKLLNESSKVKIHRTPGSGDINKVAREFAEELQNVEIDLNIIGVGPDGHVASLFPDAIHQGETRKAFEVKNSPKPPVQRITFSLNEINSAKEIWVIASGSSKTSAVEGFLDGDMKLPVSHVKASRLLVDAAAFGVNQE